MPLPLSKVWSTFQNEITSIPDLIIPRNLQLSEADECALFGYCDASADAYGCCIYVKVKIAGEYRAYLLCSKSRVAPLNSKLTIPKLELNGALLLAKLILKVSKEVPSIQTINLFSDSKIVLGWLNSGLHSLPPYVANRVKEISVSTVGMKWYHTPGVFNPADILSRCVSPSDLHKNKLWWQGPDYLHCEDNNNYNLYTSIIEGPMQSNSVETVPPLFIKYSSLYKMQRVICYIIRFINKCKGNAIETGNFTAKELKNALNVAIKNFQLSL